MAVEQNLDQLNSDTEEVGDAYTAWAMLSSRLDSLPDWARSYFQNLLEQIDAFDPHDDEEVALTCGLEVPVIRSKQRKQLGTKSPHNYAGIFDWVSARQRIKGVNLDAALWDYVEDFDLDLDAYETIKSAYHKVRHARLASMDQDRPHFTSENLRSQSSCVSANRSKKT
jgi:hypothetical protein